MTMLTRQQQEERSKRYLFLGVSGTGLVCTFLISPFLGIPLLAIGAYLGGKWLKWRAKWGMRF